MRAAVVVDRLGCLKPVVVEFLATACPPEMEERRAVLLVLHPPALDECRAHVLPAAASKDARIRGNLAPRLPSIHARPPQRLRLRTRPVARLRIRGLVRRERLCLRLGHLLRQRRCRGDQRLLARALSPLRGGCRPACRLSHAPAHLRGTLLRQPGCGHSLAPRDRTLLQRVGVVLCKLVAQRAPLSRVGALRSRVVASCCHRVRLRPRRVDGREHNLVCWCRRSPRASPSLCGILSCLREHLLPHTSRVLVLSSRLRLRFRLRRLSLPCKRAYVLLRASSDFVGGQAARGRRLRRRESSAAACRRDRGVHACDRRERRRA